MGVTSFDAQLLNTLITNRKPKKVFDFGAQNNFAQPLLPAPYMSEWWRAKGIEYDSADLNAENGCWVVDLSKELGPMTETFAGDIRNVLFDFVMDFGTSEHISDDGNSYGTGKFSWEAIYNCWKNKHNLLKIGGLMINENPKTGNWPGHCFQRYTHNFYYKLCELSGYKLIQLGDVAAMGNTIDGINVLAVIEKTKEDFITLEEFKTLDLDYSIF